MKYIKYLLILTLSILALNSCSNNIAEYQIQVKDELTEYLYSVETATTGPRIVTNYEFAEEIIEEYSLKTKKKSHIETNIKNGKDILDKIILPKEKSDEILEVYFNEYNDSIDKLVDSIYGYVIGVFGDVVFDVFEPAFLGFHMYEILGYEFLIGHYQISVYYNGIDNLISLPYLNQNEYDMLFEEEILTEDNVKLMYELYTSWHNIYYREKGIDFTYNDLLERYKNGELN